MDYSDLDFSYFYLFSFFNWFFILNLVQVQHIVIVYTYEVYLSQVRFLSVPGCNPVVEPDVTVSQVRGGGRKVFIFYYLFFIFKFSFFQIPIIVLYIILF